MPLGMNKVKSKGEAPFGVLMVKGKEVRNLEYHKIKKKIEGNITFPLPPIKSQTKETDFMTQTRERPCIKDHVNQLTL